MIVELKDGLCDLKYGDKVTYFGYEKIKGRVLRTENRDFAHLIFSPSDDWETYRSMYMHLDKIKYGWYDS